MERCQRYRLALNPNKTYLAVQRWVFLGYVVSEKGREPDLEKVVAIDVKWQHYKKKQLEIRKSCLRKSDHIITKWRFISHKRSIICKGKQLAQEKAGRQLAREKQLAQKEACMRQQSLARGKQLAQGRACMRQWALSKGNSQVWIPRRARNDPSPDTCTWTPWPRA